MTEPTISKRDKAILRVGSFLGADVLSVGEQERGKTLVAGVATGEVKAPKRPVKEQLAEQFSKLTPSQLEAAEEALYEVTQRARLGERIADGEDVDNDEEDWL